MRSLVILFTIVNFLHFDCIAQFSFIVRQGVKMFSKSSTDRSLAKELELLSASRIKFATEQEAHNFLNKNSTIIFDKSAIRLGESNALYFNNGMYKPGTAFNKYASSDVIVFNSASEKEAFVKMMKMDLINAESSNLLEEFESVKKILKKRYGVTNLDKGFESAVNDYASRNLLVSHGIINLGEKDGDISYGIMEFQKLCKLSITGELNDKTVEALDGLTTNGYKQRRIDALYPESAGNRRGSYNGSFVTMTYENNRLKENYLTWLTKYVRRENPDLSLVSLYLEYLKKESYIVKDKTLWTNLEVEKGIFKFQKNNGLKLTGDFFDNETIKKLSEEISENKFFENSDGTYLYDKKKYTNFNDIPFEKSDKLSLTRTLRPEEAMYLMEKGVKFVYNAKSYLKQRNKSFKLVYLISNDVMTVRNLYDLDEIQSKKLIDLSGRLLDNKSIIKVSSFEEMIAKQNEIIKKKEVPVLIFHNNITPENMSKFAPETNLVTCNSFKIKPDSYLTSTDFLDMQSIITSINLSYSNKSLQDFYSDFTKYYTLDMKTRNQQTALVVIGGGVLVGGGVYTIVLYNSK